MTDVGAGRVIARKVLANVIVGAPFIALTYAGLLTWVEAAPFAETLRAGVAFAVVWLTGRGAVGLWRLRHHRDRFLPSGALYPPFASLRAEERRVEGEGAFVNRPLALRVVMARLARSAATPTVGDLP